MPVAALVDECPLYDLEPAEPEGWTYPNADVLGTRVAVHAGRSADPDDPSTILLALLASPSVASKRWAFEQYDSVVLSHTVRRPEAADAAVLHLHEAGRDDRGRDRRQRAPGRLRPVRGHGRGRARVRPEPRLLGRRAARAHQLPQLRQPREADGRLAARPLDPGPRRRLRGARRPGRRRQRLALQRDRGRADLPDAGGRHGRRAARSRRAPGASRSADGDAIAVCGPFSPSLAGSELAKLRGDLGPGLPSLPIDACARRSTLVRDAVREGAVRAAHDVSDGGLACALAEMAIAGGVGLEVDLDPLVEARGCSGETALFGEGPGGFVLAGGRGELERLARPAVDVFVVGAAGGDRIAISAADAEVDVALADAARAWRSLAERARGAGGARAV